jgi:DNA-binding response OmpR family regulator
MRIVFIDREPAFLDPVADELRGEGFEVLVVENITGALAHLKQKSIQFLVADSAILVDHSLGSEVLAHYPLTRLIVLAARPSLLGMLESLGRGLTDYLPREEESFGQLVDTIMDERSRLARWQRTILSPLFARKG